MVANKTIVISEDTKQRLELLKIIDQDTMDNVIGRLLDKNDKEFKEEKD